MRLFESFMSGVIGDEGKGLGLLARLDGDDLVELRHGLHLGRVPVVMCFIPQGHGRDQPGSGCSPT